MMKLPKSINIIKAANESNDYLGYMKTLELDKLRTYLHESHEDNSLYVKVTVKQDLQYRYIVNLEIKGEIYLTCQRCLGELKFNIDKQLDLIALNTIDNISNKEGDFEPVILDDSGKLDLYDIISDEVILSIPQVPRHAVEKCSEVSNVIEFEAAI